VISLTLVVLAALIAVVALTRADSVTLGALVVASALVGRLLVRDLRKHPANFPALSPPLRENPERRRVLPDGGWPPMSDD
jgi:hypothetical protein